jgi:fatty acid/phospholipid biosynthesis enzyme
LSPDVDGDGHTALGSCAGTADDCDDGDAANYPGNAEICDLQDNNCDTVVDEGFDVDLDGVTSCGGDCDDGDASNYPGNAEVCDAQDNNCDTVVDEGFDVDLDGVTSCGGDCDDGDAANYPGNVEVCDAQDNNCDTVVDEGLSPDVDADGHTALGSCAGTADDCDDGDAANYPGNVEICDLQDNNCDTVVDEGLSPDVDGDGHTALGSCAGTADDCDDGDAANYPGNVEICELQDNNCDTVVDEGFDVDLDGVTSCGGDCDDGDAANYPGNVEICELQDNNCDTAVDEGLSPDVDGDGHTALGS